VLADTHCHLYFDTFAEDLDQVLERAQNAGVKRILVPGIDLESSRDAVTLTEKYPFLKAAIGIHPNDALSWASNTLQELRDLASHPNVAAIGEIGLDYFRDRAPRELQIKIFREQLELAAERKLPVVIHNRDAVEDIWDVLAAWQEDLAREDNEIAARPGVLHSYDGTADLSEDAFNHHFYFGVSGPVTFKNARTRQEMIARLPLEALLIETDAPFLTPHPHRGQRNEPAYVALIVDKLADLHNQPVNLIAERTSRNADRLFQWGAVD
jgi:TatD DNase family protein